MKVDKSQSGRPYTGRTTAERPSSGGRRPAGKPQFERQSERAPRSSGKAVESSQDREEYVWVLDYLPYGKSIDGKSAYQKKPLVQAIGGQEVYSYGTRPPQKRGLFLISSQGSI